MDGLRHLARSDRDRRERRHEASVVEHPFHDRQDVRVHRDLLVERPVREQVVDPPGRGAFEAVARRADVEGVLEPLEIRAQRVDDAGVDRVRDDRVAQVLELGGVRVHEQ